MTDSAAHWGSASSKGSPIVTASAACATGEKVAGTSAVKAADVRVDVPRNQIVEVLGYIPEAGPKEVPWKLGCSRTVRMALKEDGFAVTIDLDPEICKEI